jgi:hypothetical protein
LEEFELPEFPGLSKDYGVSNIPNINDNFAFKDPNSLLLSLYNCLVNILTHFCGVVAEYLDCVENVYDLLTEYTARVIFDILMSNMEFSGMLMFAPLWK